MTLAELQAKKNKLQEERDGIFAKLETEKRSSLTIEERDRVLAIDAEAATLALVQPVVPAPVPQPAPALNPRQTEDDPPQLGRQRLAAEDDPKKGFKTHREFLASVMEAGRTGKLDPRLGACRSLTAGSDEASGASDPYGGFLLPTAFSPNLLSVMAESDPLAGLTTQIPMEAAVVQIPARTDKNHTSSVSGGLRVYRRAETDDAASSRMQVERVTLAAHSLFGVAYATEELLARSPISFVALLEAGFKDEFVAELMNERLNGSGVGEYEGAIASPCVVEVSAESGQSADTIVKSNIDKMVSRCWRYGQAVWLANHDTRPQLKSLVQTVGTGGAAVPYFTNEGGQEQLDGRPIFFTEFCPKLGDAGDLFLGVWSQYLEGVLSGMQSADSVHVRFINHERTFKFWMENDGRCWWRSALTPKYSTATLSPFVKLAAR